MTIDGGTQATVVENGKATVLTNGKNMDPEQKSHLIKLPPEFYASYISEKGKKRRPESIRSLYPLEKLPGVISLLAGKPNPSTFPITDLQVSVRAPTLSEGGDTLSASEKAGHTRIALSTEQLAAGLQYGLTDGYEPLLNWLADLQEHVHGRRVGFKEGTRITMGSGSQDLLSKAFNALINPGDSILVESSVYSSVPPLIKENSGEVISVPTDAHGIQSYSLRSILENWPPSKPLPKLLYTVPYGCNPTGATTTLERRREVLELSQKYNFLILEDDPYYHLYYGKAPRPPSYFSLERQLLPEVGRVLRFDSLSKILSAGIRIGFASGPAPILDVIDLQTATSNLQVSSLTQVITYSVLQTWGISGFLVHSEGVADFYRKKRDMFEELMYRHFKGLAEWSIPEAGMFFWFKLLLNPNPNPDSAVEEDSEKLIRTTALAHGVLALPGAPFMSDGRKTAYVRASFSLISPEEADEALRRLKEVVQLAREVKA